MAVENIKLPKLPVGVQTFDDIRTSNSLYVDKTGFLPVIDRMSRAIFCARPRRFGKSLTVSALEAFYTGRKDLFKGLAAEEYMNGPDFRTRPVIWLDMSGVGEFDSKPMLRSALDLMLERLSADFKVNFVPGRPTMAFQYLIIDVSRASDQQVVVLVDEYDAPIIEALGKPELMDDVRTTLRAFYKQLKAADRYIHKIFITGISKFSRTGIFSALNNLVDISVDNDFSAFMGITHEELKENFRPHIRKAAENFGLDETEMENRMEAQYNGFSFDGETRVYNPYSTLCFLEAQSRQGTNTVFRNYWVNSGSNDFIRAYLKGHNLDVEDFRMIPVRDDFGDSPGSLEETTPEGFLYQAGYLTLRKKGAGFFLDYPNYEVFSSMARISVELMFDKPSDAARVFNEAREAVVRRNPDGLFAAFDRHCDTIAFKDHIDAARKGIGEGFYRSHLQALLAASGLQHVGAEVPNRNGAIDIVARHYDVVWVFEVKVAKNAAGIEAALEKGREQFEARDYGGRFIDPVCIVVAMDEERRQVGGYLDVSTGQQVIRDAAPDDEAPDEEDDGPRP